jgi:hypothetical protein
MNLKSEVACIDRRRKRARRRERERESKHWTAHSLTCTVERESKHRTGQ